MTSSKYIVVFAFVSTFLAVYVYGHGSMVIPNSWFDKKQWIDSKEGPVFDYIGMKPGMMCNGGCDINAAELCPGKPDNCGVPRPGCACMWFNNYTYIERPTLFDPKLRTYAHSKYQQYTLHNPWRAPGFAHIDSPCGVAGGNLNGCSGDGRCPGGGYSHGPKAEEFDFKHEIKITNWTRGSIVEAAWGIKANHGGGYSYRLCKVPREEGVFGITEECFQQTPLAFFGNTHWVQYGEDKSTRVEFPANRVNVGTWPKGSQWTKDPIPACNGASGGFFLPTSDCPNGTQFPPPQPSLYGFGGNIRQTVKPFQFSIIDKLVIPKTLEPGNYVLSFRWDCEQTPQVWNTCASIFLD